MLRTHLVLGRVSNLPTVWTNVLAGAVLAGALPGLGALFVPLLACTLFYIGGMYLNDAYDAEIDRTQGKDRPIGKGAIAREMVFTLGFAFLGIGAALGFAAGLQAGLAAIALATAVWLYDWSHKRTALAPVIMGVCRFLTYAVAALAVGTLSEPLLLGGLGLLAHVVGLTYAAKQEGYDRIERVWPLAVLALPALIGAWLAGPAPLALALLALYVAWTLWALRYLFRRRPGDVPRGVISLIAGIALYDAVMIGAMGAPILAVLAVLGFVLTLTFQRVIPGT